MKFPERDFVTNVSRRHWVKKTTLYLCIFRAIVYLLKLKRWTCFIYFSFAILCRDLSHINPSRQSAKMRTEDLSGILPYDGRLDNSVAPIDQINQTSILLDGLRKRQDRQSLLHFIRTSIKYSERCFAALIYVQFPESGLATHFRYPA